MKIFITVVLIFTISKSVFSSEYDVDKSRNNLVKFISQATFQEFDGITNNIKVKSIG